uniref:Uncharacterized protein n=1 Tax=Anguilla anguilla TaxID=7936 RepID=A0A0E9W1J9_ANGAN
MCRKMYQLQISAALCIITYIQHTNWRLRCTWFRLLFHMFFTLGNHCQSSLKQKSGVSSRISLRHFYIIVAYLQWKTK